MNINLNEEVCKKRGLTLNESLVTLLVSNGANIQEIIESLIDRKVIVPNSILQDNFMITQRWHDELCNILLDSDKDHKPIDRIESLSKALMEAFPKGKKQGTQVMWRGNLRDISLKLKKFFKLYGSQYTDEQIIEATTKYVNSFNGIYNYMRVLKYFIWKDERKVDSEGNGYIEEVSELANYLSMIESGEEIEDHNNWTGELR